MAPPRVPIPFRPPTFDLEEGAETLFALGEQFRQLAQQRGRKRKRKRQDEESDDKSGADDGSRRGVRDPSARRAQRRTQQQAGPDDLASIIRDQERTLARRTLDRKRVGPVERARLNEIELKRQDAIERQRRRVLGRNASRRNRQEPSQFGGAGRLDAELPEELQPDTFDPLKAVGLDRASLVRRLFQF